MGARRGSCGLRDPVDTRHDPPVSLPVRTTPTRRTHRPELRQRSFIASDPNLRALLSDLEHAAATDVRAEP